MTIEYNHSHNTHTLAAPAAALPLLLAGFKPASLLDVGCGPGTWMKTALALGISDVFGVEGVKIPPENLLVSAGLIRHQDLTQPWDLNKQFDVVLCLEVAEHLASSSAPVLIDALVKHGTRIYFSAACPNQSGEHHINCQWPAYWQQLFNERGFVCEDSLRWQLWEDSRIEWWYRQNIFTARSNAGAAGREPRIKAVLHPDWFAGGLSEGERFKKYVRQIENGRMKTSWYLKTPISAISQKLKRHLG
jgi:SAM-dependent methyltransferase